MHQGSQQILRTVYLAAENFDEARKDGNSTSILCQAWEDDPRMARVDAIYIRKGCMCKLGFGLSLVSTEFIYIYRICIYYMYICTYIINIYTIAKGTYG